MRTLTKMMKTTRITKMTEEKTFMESMENPITETPPSARIKVDVGDGIYYNSAPVFNNLLEAVETIQENLKAQHGLQLNAFTLPLYTGQYLVIPGAALVNCHFIAEEV